MDYVDQKPIKIADHNELTDEFFRWDDYHRWVAECKSSYEKAILDRANGYFYVVEQKSAKIPDNRPQWNQIIKLVKQWKINGILSYAPDRHARNLVESWELVQLIDQNYLDVQYTNFTFENNENGRMILGINFVISYNYSDNLSKVTKRWKAWVIDRWQADGKYKYGYFINEEKYHQPDPDYFKVWKEAFRRKIYDQQTDQEIWQYIVSSWFKRKYKKNNRVSDLNVKNLYKIWIDDFYYWKLISGDNEVDLRDGINPYYEHLITEDEYLILLDRHLKNNPTSLRTYKTKEEYDDIMPFPNKFIQYNWTDGLSFSLSNKKRYIDKLVELQIKNPTATLKDVVQPHQSLYKTDRIKVNWKQLAINTDVLINTVYNYLNHCFNVDDVSYTQYREYQINEYDNTMNRMNEEKRKLQNRINHTTSLMATCARNFTNQQNPDQYQRKVYENDISRYSEQIEYMEAELKKLWQNQRNVILELDWFIQCLSKLAKVYDKASYVRKKKIILLLFSNIIIDDKKQVTFKPKPWLEGLFIQLNRDDRTRTCDHKTPSLVF